MWWSTSQSSFGWRRQGCLRARWLVRLLVLLETLGLTKTHWSMKKVEDQQSMFTDESQHTLTVFIYVNTHLNVHIHTHTCTHTHHTHIKPGSVSNECLIDCMVHLKQLLCCNFCRLFMLYLESSIYGIKWKMNHILREIHVSVCLK